MLPEHIDEQAWHAKRLGKVTASRISDVIARTKSGWGAGRANYLAQLVAERMTGTKSDSFVNAAMLWGIEKEKDALALYAFENDAEVLPADFIDHPVIVMSGASPDGMVGPRGLIECKCPQTATHIETLLAGKIDGKYIMQMQWQMACAGAEWCDFASFDPRMPADLQLWVKRIERDDAHIKELEGLVVGFLAELDDKIRLLQALRSAA